MTTTPERLLKHAEFVRAADRDERELRQLTAKLDRLDAKVADGHANLVRFRDRLNDAIDKNAGRHHAAARRRALIDEVTATLPTTEAVA